MRQADPTFSVVIPLFDKAPTIAATLASVLAQSRPAIEVIVIDDGSRDGGDAIVAAMVDPRIRLIRQRNAGPGPARNTGFAAATGQWVAMIDADDLWRPDHLANLAAVIAAVPQADMVAAASRMVDAGARADDAGDAGPEGAPYVLDFFGDHFRTRPNGSSAAIRRAVFAGTGGFGGDRAGEDMAYWVRFALDHVMAVSDRATALYVRGTGGIMERAQAGMARGEPVPVSPVLAALDAALARADLADRHAAIAAYADRSRVSFARTLLYNGRGRLARRMLAGVRGDRAVAVYRLASFAPDRLLRGAAAMFSRIKRLR